MDTKVTPLQDEIRDYITIVYLVHIIPVKVTKTIYILGCYSNESLAKKEALIEIEKFGGYSKTLYSITEMKVKG